MSFLGTILLLLLLFLLVVQLSESAVVCGQWTQLSLPNVERDEIRNRSSLHSKELSQARVLEALFDGTLRSHSVPFHRLDTAAAAAAASGHFTSLHYQHLAYSLAAVEPYYSISNIEKANDQFSRFFLLKSC